jgi:hypothetical protein
MTDFILTKTRIQAGIYEGILKSTTDTAARPDISCVLLEQEVGDLTLNEDPTLAQTWHLKFFLPSSALTDGIQTFLIIDKLTSETLDSFTIITGEPLNDDLQAEVDLLRAELDMLKKAFRRHCVETS